MQIRPQPIQWKFLENSADIVIAGGAYFGGKTWSCLIDVLRDVENPLFQCVFFRRVMPQITAPGGLWDEARTLYQQLYPTAEFVSSPQHKVRFPSGAECVFSQMQYEDNRYDWDGAQVAAIYFDQLEQFTERQFWHLALGRNRSNSGIEPRVRATCNPLPKTWLSELLQWWWNPDTGYAIPERSGVIRYMLRVDNTIHWADSPEALREKFPDMEADEFLPMSFTFIPSTLDDNPIGTKLNPRYAAQLQNLPLVERERGRKGNWKIEDITGDGLFRPEWWKVLSLEVWNEILEAPTANFRWARGWDPAGGQSKGSDYSSGALVGHAKDRNDKRIIIGNITRGQWSPGVRNQMMAATARADAKFEPGFYFWRSRTPDMNRSILDDEEIAKFGFWATTERGRKFQRAQRLAVQAEAGNVYLAPGDWNAEFILEASLFKDEDSDEVRKDDQVDCVCLADSQLIKWN